MRKRANPLSYLLSGVLALAIVACTDTADSPENNAAVADVDVLPPDESVATSNEELAIGAVDDPARNAAAVAPEIAIPAALHGKWGLTANDCEPGRSDAKGLVTITADGVRFYESVAKPARVSERTANSIRGEFAFTGEGMTGSGPMSWSVEGDRLTRIDSEPDSRLVYTRC